MKKHAPVKNDTKQDTKISLDGRSIRRLPSDSLRSVVGGFYEGWPTKF